MVRLLLAFLLFPALAEAQTLTYQWLNQPCSSMLNCVGGCSACNLPDGSGQTLIGNEVALLGVDVCPHPVLVGDNALLTYGWPFTPDTSHMVIVTGIALQPMTIDSVIIRHRAGVDGPQRLLVKFGTNAGLPTEELADVPVPSEFAGSSFTDLGTVQAAPEMVFGYFSLTLQPYQGNGGSWDLDELRISASPAATTTVVELDAPAPQRNVQPMDLLGRRVPPQRALGIYFDGRVKPVLR